jgi:transposase
LDEICFPYFPSREGENVYRALGEKHPPGAVLLTDGYGVYASYAKRVGLTRAQCWSHGRREIFEAESADPEGTREGLRRIAALYCVFRARVTIDSG